MQCRTPKDEVNEDRVDSIATGVDRRSWTGQLRRFIVRTQKGGQTGRQRDIKDKDSAGTKRTTVKAERR
jgi:hypothetical protein